MSERQLQRPLGALTYSARHRTRLCCHIRARVGGPHSAPNERAVVDGATPRAPWPAAYSVPASAAGALSWRPGNIALVTAAKAILATLVTSMAGLWMIATARYGLAGPAHVDGNAPQRFHR
jgi:hypothetical protein